MNEKIVRLFNGKHAIITITSSNDIAYYIRAYDSSGQLIGACNFSLTKVFSRPLTEVQRARLANIKSKYNSIDEVPKSLDIEITKSNYEKHKNNIIDDTLTLSTGNIFKYKNIFCKLASIDILDQNFFKVGLGTVMWNEMENIAKTQNCTHIEAHFYPHGAFQHGTSRFYNQKGCYYTKKDSKTYVVKDLHQKSNEIEK